MNDLIKALQIFMKYIGDVKYPTSCEHDVFYVQVDPAIVSDEDICELENLGFQPNSESNNFESYKYGSC